MLTYSFEDRQGKRKFEYLYEQIREDILKGTLKPGEKLPSKRALAEHLGISVITVEGAYGQLLDEGYIISPPEASLLTSRRLWSCRMSEAAGFPGKRPPARPAIFLYPPFFA